MRIQLLSFSLIITFVMAQTSVSIPELDKIIEGTNLIKSIPIYLNKTREVFEGFDGQDQKVPAEKKTGLSQNKPSFFDYVNQIGTVASTISSGIDLFGKVTSFLGFKFFPQKSSSAQPDYVKYINQLSQQISQISKDISILRSQIMARLDAIDTMASWRDINQDIIVLYSMISVFNNTDNVNTLQFVCGYSIERCNLAFVSACQKTTDYIGSLVATTQNVTLADSSAGSIYGLLAKSMPIIVMINGWSLQSVGKLNFTNYTGDEINLLSNGPFLAAVYTESIEKTQRYIDSIQISSKRKLEWLAWGESQFLTLSDDVSMIKSFDYSPANTSMHALGEGYGMMFTQLNCKNYTSNISDSFYWSGRDKFTVTASNSTCPRNEFLKGLKNRKVNFDSWGKADILIYGASDFSCCSIRNAKSSTCVKVSSPVALPFYQGTTATQYAPLYNYLKCPENYYVTGAYGKMTFKLAPKSSFTGSIPYLEITCCKSFT